MHRSKQYLYSINSSAVTRSDGDDDDAERLRGLQVDHQFELARLQDRQIAWLSPFENSSDVVAGLAIAVGNIRSVAHQPAAIAAICTAANSGVMKGPTCARLAHDHPWIDEAKP